MKKILTSIFIVFLFMISADVYAENIIDNYEVNIKYNKKNDTYHVEEKFTMTQVEPDLNILSKYVSELDKADSNITDFKINNKTLSFPIEENKEYIFSYDAKVHSQFDSISYEPVNDDNKNLIINNIIIKYDMLQDDVERLECPKFINKDHYKEDDKTFTIKYDEKIKASNFETTVIVKRRIPLLNIEYSESSRRTILIITGFIYFLILFISIKLVAEKTIKKRKNRKEKEFSYNNLNDHSVINDYKINDDLLNKIKKYGKYSSGYTIRKYFMTKRLIIVLALILIVTSLSFLYSNLLSYNPDIFIKLFIALGFNLLVFLTTDSACSSLISRLFKKDLNAIKNGILYKDVPCKIVNLDKVGKYYRYKIILSISVDGVIKENQSEYKYDLNKPSKNTADIIFNKENDDYYIGFDLDSKEEKYTMFN